MTILRRFLVLAVLMFWQGGFLFYAAVVVPVGRASLGPSQSIVTQRVTIFLNLAGAAASLPLAWDVWTTPSRRSWRWACWLGMAAALPALIWLHGRIDGLIAPGTPEVLDHQTFYPSHQMYLWLSTLQWAFAMFFVVLSLGAWSEVDRLMGAAIDKERSGMGCDTSG